MKGKISFDFFVLGIFPGLIFIVCRLLDFNGLYGQDAYEYARYSEEIHHFLITGNRPNGFFWPVVYPLLGAVLRFFFGDSAVSSQVVSIFSFAGSLFFVSRIVTFFYPEKPAILQWFSFLFFGLSPFLVRSSVQVMADSPGLFFLIAGTFFALRYSTVPVIKNIGWAVFLLALSGLTRYGNAVAAIVPLLVVGTTVVRQRKWKHFLFSVLAVGMALVPHLFFQVGNTTEFFSHPWLKEWSPAHFFMRRFSNVDGIQEFNFSNIIYVIQVFYYPGFIFIGGMFFILLFFKIRPPFSFAQKFSISVLVLYLIFIAGIPFQNVRYLLPAFPFVLILYFPFFVRIYEDYFKEDRKKKFIFVLIFFLQTGSSLYGLRKTYYLNKTEKEISFMISSIPAHSVYTVGFEGPPGYYLPEKKVQSIWKKDFSEPQDSDLLILNEAQWSIQWAELEVSESIRYLRRNYDWDKLESFSSGWIVYRIRPKQLP